ncbi:sensor histidine kinase [Candidatus Galacturonibacter soehngenii]|nr:HAMP domain-containing sensor histidine kinase [Candidatus Galacturonibacter soehngenii]
MKLIIIVVLSVILVALLLYIIVLHTQIRQILEAVKKLNDKNYHKLFVKGNSSLSKVALQINEIEQRHQEELRRINKIEQANKELLTSLSHDVRTPLTSLMGYLEALEEGVFSKEEERKYINIARRKSYDLKKLVDTLFDWFKINSNEMQLKYEKLDICEQMRQIIIAWLPIFDKNKILCNVQVPEEEYFLIIDQSAFNRVINNVLQNCVDHSKAKQIDIRVERRNSNIKIEIKDNGIGMARKQLEHVFERLYKGDYARSKTNSGLGLCIAKQLTKMMGADINVESELGKGTVFYVVLPF